MYQFESGGCRVVNARHELNIHVAYNFHQYTH